MKIRAKILLFSLAVAASFFAPSYSDPATPPPTKLKIRQPNWRPQVLKTFPDGTTQEVLLFQPDQNTAQEVPTKLLLFFSDGTLASETDLVPTKGTPPYVAHGPSIIYNSSGKAETITFYDHGKLFHCVKNFYSEGQLQAYYPLQDGLYEGIAEKYDTEGNVIERFHYSHDILHGKYDKFHSNGKKSSASHYQHGLMHGESTEWNSDGKVTAISYYYRGLLNDDKGRPALSKFYPNGQTAEVQNFRMGQPAAPTCATMIPGKKVTASIISTAKSTATKSPLPPVELS